jgi:DNA-binding NarL/FixJ family response regulator
MNQHRKQILVVDDHPLIRKGLCDAIRAQQDMDVCAEAGSLAEAKTAIVEIQPDAVVLDLNLPDGNGWTLIEDLSLKNTLPPTLVLSVNDEYLYATRLLNAGARGYLMKDTPIQEILTAIRKVLTGHIAVSDAVTDTIAEQKHPGSAAEAIKILSDRELQVFDLLAQGFSNKIIAERLSVSAKTVGTYKTRLMEKLGLRTTPDLFAFAAEQVSKNTSS